MIFNYSYDIVSLIVLIVIAIKFFTSRQFPAFSNKMYGILLGIGIIDLASDIIGSILINGAIIPVPVVLVYIINTINYISQILLTAAMFLYTVALMGNNKHIAMSKYVLASIPAAFFIVLLLITIPQNLVFTVAVDGNYGYGPFSIATYVCVAIYFVLVLGLIVLKPKQLSKKERASIFAYIGIAVITVIIQKLYPAELLTGTGVAISFLIMFFTIQDPSLTIDAETGVFTGNAMKKMFDIKYDAKSNFHIAVIEMHGLHNMYMLYGRKIGNECLKRVGDFILAYKKSWVYRAGDALFIASFATEKELAEFAKDFETHKYDTLDLSNNISIVPGLTMVCINNALQFTGTRELMAVVENAFDKNNILPIKGKSVYLSKDDIYGYKRNVIIEDEIKEELPNDSNFFTVYQPIYSLKDNKYASLEALTRYNSKLLGRVKPEEFIPIVEKQGLAIQFDEMVTRKVFTDIVNGTFAELDLDSIHINLSAASFAYRGFIDKLVKMIDEYKIDPSFVVFEITETSDILSSDFLARHFKILNDAGFGLALDDFGTGYANIQRLFNLPFSHVKLDKTLIKGSSKFLGDLVNLLKNFSMEIIAEGIEDERQLKLVEEAGASYIQGYYYSKPLEKEKLLDVIKNKS